jgi:hypothetical protein
MSTSTALVPEIDSTMVAPVLRPQITKIATVEDADSVAKFNSECASRIKAIQEFFSEAKEAAHKTHKAICAKEKACCAMFEEGQQWAKKSLTEWAMEEQRRREEAQRKLDEEARLKAVEEARANGEKRLANQIESGKVAVVSETIVAQPVKIHGFATQKSYEITVLHPLRLLRAIVQGNHPITWVTFDLKEMEASVKRTNGAMRIEGCAIRPGITGRRTR